MIRLARYEMRKALSNRLYWIALPICLLIVVLDILRPWDTGFMLYRNLSHKNFGFFHELDRMDEAEFDDFTAYMVGRFGPDFDDIPPSEIQNQPGRYAERIVDEAQIAMDYVRMARERKEIIEGRQSIVRNAERLGRKALAAGDGYNARRNERIADIYSNELNLGRIPTIGWNGYYRYPLSGIFALLLTVMLCSTVFSGEGSFTPLLRSTRYGLRTTAGAKLLSAAILAFAQSILLSLLSLLAFHYKYGLYGWTKPIASVIDMGFSPLNVSIWQYTALFIGSIGFGAALLAIVCCAVSSLTRNGLKAYISCVLFLGASYAYSYLANRPQHSRMLLLPDITLWTRPSELSSRYMTANLFSYPVSWLWIYLCGWVLLTVAIVAITLHRSMRNPRVVI